MVEVNKNFYCLHFKGALTNKPQAFKFRAWELESIRTRDLFDSFVGEILVEMRGFEIMRILPVHNTLSEYTWITDKTRFFFDSLKYQRIKTPLLFLNESVFKVDWLYSLVCNTFFLFQLKQTWLDLLILKLGSVSSRVGFTFNFFGLHTSFLSDCSTLLNFSLLSRVVGSGSFFFNNALFSRVFLNNHHETDFITSLNFDKVLKDHSFILLMGVDIRYELPKFYLFLRRKNKTKHFKIFLLNVRLKGNHNFNYIHLGFTLSTLVKILEGRHWFNGFLRKNTDCYETFPLFLFGNAAFSYLKTKQLSFLLTSFCAKFKVKVFNLYTQTVQVNVAFCNFRPLCKFFKNYTVENHFINNRQGIMFYENLHIKMKTAFFLNKNFLNILFNSFFSHDSGLLMRLTLPCFTLFERDFLTTNILGEVLHMKSFLTPIKTREQFSLEQKAIYQVFYLLFCLLLLNKSTKFSVFLNSIFFSGQKFQPFLASQPRQTLRGFSFIGAVLDFVFHYFCANFYKTEEFSKQSLVLTVVDNFSTVKKTQLYV